MKQPQVPSWGKLGTRDSAATPQLHSTYVCGESNTASGGAAGWLREVQGQEAHRDSAEEFR